MKELRFYHRKKDEIRMTPNDTNKIKISGRNYTELKECNTALKFRIPETLENKIDEICTFLDTTATDLIRQTLFIHLYGRYDLLGLVERQDNTYRLLKPVKFKFLAKMSNTPSKNLPTPEIEKNRADLKVWIPARMKNDLQLLATRAGCKLSPYVREVVTTSLLGHILPDNYTTEVHGSNDDEEC